MPGAPLDATVIGSGPSSVHAALTLLERGARVEMIDIGETEPPVPHPEAGARDLRTVIDDPVRYFLGPDFQGMIPPTAGDLYTLPPNRRYIASPGNTLTRWASSSFRPVVSHAQGGLGIGWGANCLEYDDADFAGFPIGRSDLEEGYRIVGERIGVSGSSDDDLAAHLPCSSNLDPPLPLNAHEALLLQRYARAKARISQVGCTIGRSRLAVTTRDREGRGSCALCDRCIWGCGRHAIYDPRQTLERCRQFAGFRYVDGYAVSRFLVERGRITAVEAIDTLTRTPRVFPVSNCFLGAGALNSAVILLRTLTHDTSAGSAPGGSWRTPAVLDTPVIRMPYILPAMIGRSAPASDFQFNKLNLGMVDREGDDRRYIHGEIITLGSLLYHPLINALPFGARIGTSVFRRLKGALGALTLFLPDAPSGHNGISLEPDRATATGDRAVIGYVPSDDTTRLSDRVIHVARKVLRSLGAVVPNGMISRYPPGAGLHYAGTIPMTPTATPLGVDRACRSHAYPNLYVVDGAAFPRLPSRSITFSLMANAVRVARLASVA